MAAQFDYDELDGTDNLVYNIAINDRNRSSPRVHEEAMGSFLRFIQVKKPIRQILEGDNLVSLSFVIRKAILAMDKDFSGSCINDLISLVNQQKDLGLLIPTSFLDVPCQTCAQIF
ncbi:hypothetical protein FSARC_13999 [Fusarium sarcochroum]|uniref:Uncharacterized protein n=1 Tax=Fusarium sarcochroum TaxID=1208366 RepID=A0A8H4SX26_9HYPO|nr:hypothetical protein FSARC_13999 [Fusarium sarcochroum]